MKILKIKVLTKNADLISKIYSGSCYFYICNKKNADISFRLSGKKYFYQQRSMKINDQGFYFSGNHIKIFNIKSGEIRNIRTLLYQIKGNHIKTIHSKGKSHNMKLYT